MKIVCDNCATKYSIADEKVRGKVFKIRCKKCSHIIVVKGTDGAGAELGATAEPTAYDAPAEQEAPAADGWHVVINGEQTGPLSPGEIRAKFAAGQIDAETYAWKEGFGDWQRLASIDDFRDLAPAAPVSDSTKRTGADDLFGGDQGGPSPSGDLFGAAGGDLFAGGGHSGGAANQGNAGLFAQGAADAAPARRSPTPGFGAPAMADASVAAAPDKAMTGARNENSVLFSLNNLQALASGGGSQKPAAAVENRAGFANSQTEGSGLIDIRAMAAATLSSGGSSSQDRSNDLPAFSSAPVFSPIAAPILMPSAPSGPPKWIWPVIGLGVAAVVSIVVVGVMILNKKPDTVAVAAPVAPVAAPSAAPVAAGGTPPAAPAPGAPAAVPGTPSAPVAAAPAAAPDKGGSHPGSSSKSSRSSARADKGAKGGSAPVAAAAPEPAAASAPAKKKAKGDDLDDLLNGASPDKGGGGSRAREDKPSNDENLPDTLDKGAIVGGMGKVKGKVAGCYEQFKVPGLANVAVTIAKSGKVSSATVSGAFAGTPTGGCVEKAVKSATFPPFKSSSQTVNYPFMLR